MGRIGSNAKTMKEIGNLEQSIRILISQVLWTSSRIGQGVDAAYDNATFFWSGSSLLRISFCLVVLVLWSLKTTHGSRTKKRELRTGGRFQSDFCAGKSSLPACWCLVACEKRLIAALIIRCGHGSPLPLLAVAASLLTASTAPTEPLP